MRWYSGAALSAGHTRALADNLRPSVGFTAHGDRLREAESPCASKESPSGVQNEISGGER